MSLYQNFLETFLNKDRNILLIKCDKHILRKVGNLVEKLCIVILDEESGYPEIFGLSQNLEMSRQYLLRTVILQKKVVGATV